MPLFLLGAQKYVVAVLAAFVLLFAASSWYYRTSYYVENVAKVQIEQALEETNATIDNMLRTHAHQLAALERARFDALRLNKQRTTARERILNAPATQDGPVADVLRCAVTGVCN